MEVDLHSLIVSISGCLKTLMFQWARIEDRVWLHLPLFKTRHQKLIVNTAVTILEVRKLLKLQGVAYIRRSL